MAIQGSRRLGATQQQVWEILRSPDALRRIMPGLDLLEAQGADRYRWSADIQGGPLSRRLEGNASVGEKHAPLGAVVTFDGGPENRPPRMPPAHPQQAGRCRRPWHVR